MDNRIKLSDGSLDLILEQRNLNLRPIVQVLGAKVLANNRLRVVVFDGRTLCQHCIMIAEEMENLFNQGQLDKFTIIRLEQYSVSSIPKKENTPVILVQKVEIIKNGNDVGKKLDPDESIDLVDTAASAGTSGNTSAAAVADSVMTDSVSSSAIIRNTMNQLTSSAQKKPPMKATAGDIEIRTENVCPISVLTPFYNSWMIRALCIHKGAHRTYSNQRGQGRLFSFDLCDDTGEIRVTCFNDECDRFYNLIQKDRCYYVGRGMIKTANKKFSTVNNDYEITLTQNSFVKLCEDAQIEAPKLRYKFIPLATIADKDANSAVDVIGVIRSVGEIETLTSKKTSKDLIKREIIIVDKSLAEARLTLWGEQAQMFNGQPDQILALKGASIGDFKGKTLSARDSTDISIDPDLPEKNLLEAWHCSLSGNENFNQLSKTSDSPAICQMNHFIAQIIPKKLKLDETFNFYTTATVHAFNRIHNQLYKACGYNKCQKKVTDTDGTGAYHCSKCERTSAIFEWRLMISVLLGDSSGSFWATLFQDQAEKLLGKSVAELVQLYEEDQNLYNAIVDELCFKQFNFRIYSRLEQYNGENRIRHTVGQIYFLKPKATMTKLLRSIEIVSRQL